MVFSWLTPKILEVRFEKSYDLCHNTYMFSHHYEDPTWNGKIFTRLELDEHYEQLHGDANWWKRRWAGSNLPDHSFEPFLDGRFIGLNDFELSLLDQVRDVSRPFYVIMTSDESLYAREHEIAHALYYTNAEYRERAQDIVKRHRGSILEAIVQLNKQGYADKVLEDELHVYCGIYYYQYFRQLNIYVPHSMQIELNNLFNEYKP